MYSKYSIEIGIISEKINKRKIWIDITDNNNPTNCVNGNLNKFTTTIDLKNLDINFDSWKSFLKEKYKSPDSIKIVNIKRKINIPMVIDIAWVLNKANGSIGLAMATGIIMNKQANQLKNKIIKILDFIIRYCYK